jgi:hypothetical protein
VDPLLTLISGMMADGGDEGPKIITLLILLAVLLAIAGVAAWFIYT